MASYKWPPQGSGSGTTGDLTDVGTDGIVISNGTGAVNGSGTGIAQHVADAGHNGYLSSTDWTAFNAKQATISLAAVGAVPNANAASLSGSTLNLQPADGSFPGVLTTGAQNIAGAKVFLAAPNFDSLTANQAVVTNSGKTATTVAYTSTGGVSNIVARDGSGNSHANNFGSFLTATTGVGSTTILTDGSARSQVLIATTTQTFQLPDATTLFIGTAYDFDNASTASMPITNNGGGAIGTIPAGGAARVVVRDISTTNGLWDIRFLMPSNASYGTAGLTITGNIAATNLSGTNTGDQTITLTGDVTGSGTGSFAATIANLAVTNAKIANTTIDLTAKVTGILPVANGGTGANTLTSNNVILGNGSSAVAFVAPGTSNNVLKSNGTTWTSGVFTPTYTAPLVTKYTSGSGTHTLTASPLYITVELAGGGGGGGGSAVNNSTGGTGGTGGTSSFGTSLLSCVGGSGGPGIYASGIGGGAGGTASLGSGPTGLALTGGQGGPARQPGGTNPNESGMPGGTNVLGGGGSPGITMGQAGATNSGAGGGGAGTATPGTGATAGGGGGAGGYLKAFISGSTLSGLSGSASYAVGAAGTAGSAGTSGSAGGAGAAGIIVVTEYYQ